MRLTKRMVGAAAAVLLLTACGADGETLDPVPGDPTSVANTTAPPTPVPSSPAPPSPGTSTLGSPSPSGVLTLVESCRAVLDDQQASVDTLQAYVRNPLSGDVAELDRLRSELLAAELSAPEPLRQELNTQVGVLNGVVQGVQDGSVQNADVDAFQDARNRITTLCEEAG